MTAACANDAPPAAPISTSVIPSASTVTTPPAQPFFAADPTIEDFQLPDAWLFRQETFMGAGESQQHCREIGYPQRNGDALVKALNALLEDHGIPAKLPETVRVPHMVFAAGDFTAGLVPLDEPVTKLIVCSEGLVPRAERDRMLSDWRNDPRVAELTFGEPSGAWKREYRNGAFEYGIRWSNITAEQAAAVFIAHGYTFTVDPTSRIPIYRLGTIAEAKLRGELWWSMRRSEPKK